MFKVFPRQWTIATSSTLLLVLYYTWLFETDVLLILYLLTFLPILQIQHVMDCPLQEMTLPSQ